MIKDTNQTQIEKQIDLLKNIILLDPKNFLALTDLGVKYKILNKFDESLKCYNKAIKINPYFDGVYYNKGTLLNDLKKYEEAITNFDIAIKLNKNSYKAYFNKSISLVKLNRLEDAIICLDKSISINYLFLDAYYNKARLLADIMKYDEAISVLDKLISFDQNYKDSKLIKSFILLATEKYKDGFYLFENRLKNNNFNYNFYYKGFLDLNFNLNYKNKIIFISSEQGIGDNIFASRYFLHLEKLGAKVIFKYKKNFKKLFDNIPGIFKYVYHDLEENSFHYSLPIMSLPNIFVENKKILLTSSPYLKSNKENDKKWKNKLEYDAFKIGICWKGGSQYKDDSKRSFSLDYFEDISKNKKIKLISLYRGNDKNTYKRLLNDLNILNFDDSFDEGDNAFIDTISIINNCDLILTSDTSLAHICGAMGKPFWLITSYTSHWYWGIKNTTPWYKSAKIFRQKKPGDWNEVFKQVAKELFNKFKL